MLKDVSETGDFLKMLRGTLILAPAVLGVIVLGGPGHSVDSIGYYRNQNLGIRLPESAEELILTKLEAKRIVEIQELIFQRKREYDYLDISVSLEVGWGFEGWYHHSFILEKSHETGSWDNATAYRSDLEILDLFNLSYKEFKAHLERVE